MFTTESALFYCANTLNYKLCLYEILICNKKKKWNFNFN